MTTTIPLGLRKCHHPNVSSVVVREGPLMRRAFIADGPTGERTVAPHSHRTSIRITVLRGSIRHHRFAPEVGGALLCDHYTYRSPLLGGEGLSKDSEVIRVEAWDRLLWTTNAASPVTVLLSFDEVHTVEWSADAVWLVDEGPVLTDTTTVLIRPGVDSMDTDGLYVPMDDDEYRHRLDLVWRLAMAAGVTL